MTIVTKPLTAVKEKKEDVEALVDVKTGAPGEHPDINLDPIPLSDPRTELRTRHRHNLAFLSLCTGLISLMGFMAGIHLYKSIYQRRIFCNSYRVPLRTIKENSLIGGKFQDGPAAVKGLAPEETMFALFNHDVTDVDRIFGDNMNSFEFDVELDLEDDMMETLELPEVFSGRYLHDFMVNLTVIVDTLGRRCFIMKLDRNTIPKPKNIFDYLNKERDGVYEVDYEEIKQSFMINGPQIDNFDLRHGRFIPDVCHDKTTYELDEVDDLFLAKREIGSSRNMFGEFVGTKLIRYNIVNLNKF